MKRDSENKEGQTAFKYPSNAFKKWMLSYRIKNFASSTKGVWDGETEQGANLCID